MTESLRRCAIYTRKSFEPPLGQEITSLESQRSICSSYISSQQHRGWTEIAKHFDDSGRTGANTARPALQALLGDVESGLIDVVLVYKIDRLTRTLLDFVTLMDFLERHDVALVSITQNFDTSDSLGRLVLNVPLTFAQFEREILSDRMRDRIRVLKSLGRWVGGAPPLGYDVVKAKLRINEQEAVGVRTIFNIFKETGRPLEVIRALDEMSFKRKIWKARTGRIFGGGRVPLSAIYHILRNPIYVGKVRHHEEIFEGIHAPIIDATLFEEVQSIVAANHLEKVSRQPRNLLTGLLFDSSGRPMLARLHEAKGYSSRYYVSNASAWARRQKLRRMRANANELESLIIASISTFLRNREQLRRILLDDGVHGAALDRSTRRGSAAARLLATLPMERKNEALHGILERVELFPDVVLIQLAKVDLVRFLEWDGVGIFRADRAARQRNNRIHTIEASAAVVRARKVFALPIEPSTSPSSPPNAALVRLLEDARRAQELMTDRRDLALPQLAEAFGVKSDRFARLVRLNYLAPDIALAIRDGFSPEALNRKSLLRAELPLDWATQRTLLGFPAKPERFRNPNRNSVCQEQQTHRTQQL